MAEHNRKELFYKLLKNAIEEVEEEWFGNESRLISLSIKAESASGRDEDKTWIIEAGVKPLNERVHEAGLTQKGYNLPDFLIISDKLIKESHLESTDNPIKKIKVVKKAAKSYYGISKHMKRPVIGGISVMNGLYKESGTLGCSLKLNNAEGTYIISNWHVFVNSNGRIGDRILQPSRLDGGKFEQHQIAELVWYRLDAYMDIALAKIHEGLEVDRGTISSPVLKGFVKPELGMRVQKYGRTTKETSGVIVDFFSSVKVKHKEYPNNGSMIFKDQIVCELKAEWGDSGSILSTPSGNVLGLIFASDLQGTCLANFIDFSRPLQAGGRKNALNDELTIPEINNFN